MQHLWSLSDILSYKTMYWCKYRGKDKDINCPVSYSVSVSVLRCQSQPRFGAVVYSALLVDFRIAHFASQGVSALLLWEWCDARSKHTMNCFSIRTSLLLLLGCATQIFFHFAALHDRWETWLKETRHGEQPCDQHTKQQQQQQQPARPFTATRRLHERGNGREWSAQQPNLVSFVVIEPFCLCDKICSDAHIVDPSATMMAIRAHTHIQLVDRMFLEGELKNGRV